MKYILLLPLLLLSLHAQSKEDLKLHNLLQANALKGKQKLPQRIGKNISITDVKVKGTTQIMHYTFDISDSFFEAKAKANHDNKDEINTQMKEIMKKDFTQRACKSMQNPMSLLAMGANYQSNFYSSDDVLQFSFSISQTDCKRNL